MVEDFRLQLGRFSSQGACALTVRVASLRPNPWDERRPCSRGLPSRDRLRVTISHQE